MQLNRLENFNRADSLLFSCQQGLHKLDLLLKRLSIRFIRIRVGE